MTTPLLFTAIEDVLQQGCVFLDSVDDETYARPLHGPLSSSLGAHYRHTLDHLFCLVDGIPSGHINYDHRRRDTEMETSVRMARLATESLMKTFRELPAQALQQQCTISYSISYNHGEAAEAPSNMAREVMFCVGHMVHHYALLRVLCRELSIDLPYEFGIAPSTLKRHEVTTEGRA